MIPGEIPPIEQRDIHRQLETVCGFWDLRKAPVLARMTGEIVQVAAYEVTVVLIGDGQSTKPHKIPPTDLLLGHIDIGNEVIYGEPLSYGLEVPFCRLQAAWAIETCRENGHSTLAYEKIARLTGVPKSSVFQSERIGLDLLKKKIAPFISDLKARSQILELTGR